MKYNLIIVLFFLTYCSHQNDTPQKWYASDIVGYSFDLIDKETVQQLSFTANGRVMATLGAVNGPITPPVFFWEIDKEGVLNIKDEFDKPVFSLIKLYTRDDIVGIECLGKKQEYKKHKWQN